MTGEPRVTVVIATYNRAALVTEAIDSVLRQSYRDLEVVVCDDGSTDDTAARVRALEDRVRYVSLAHTGRPGSPRNRGIENARGELIAFLDDDDVWQPEKLARQVELMDRDKLDLVYTDRRILFGSDPPAEHVVTPSPVAPDRLLDLVLQGHFPSVCTLLVHRSALRKAGCFDETLVTGEDLDLWLRLSPAARAGRVPEPLVEVRRRPGSVSDRSGPSAFGNAIGVLERWLEAGDLSGAQRRICRATLAQLSSGLSTILTGRGERPGAVRAALRAVRYAPASRRSWAALAATVMTRAGPHRS